MAYADSAATERSNRRYISAAMDAPVLEREYEVDLARRWNDKRDERAMHEIVEAHARLVVRIAAGFRSSGLPMADLMQEGNIGLMEAVERFDHEREVRFSTYASWWIVASIQNYILRNSSIVRAATTPKQRRLFFNLRRLRAQLSTGFDGQLTTDERQIIADKLDVTVADVERMELHLTRPDQSLNSVIGQEDDGAQFQDLLEDTGPGPEELAANARRPADPETMAGIRARQTDAAGTAHHRSPLSGRGQEHLGRDRRGIRCQQGTDPPDREPCAAKNACLARPDGRIAEGSVRQLIYKTDLKFRRRPCLSAAA